MKIFLMRHAESDPGPDMDDKRTLTDVGKQQCKTMRRFLEDLGAAPTLILYSSMQRGQETAKRMNKHLGVDAIMVPALDPDRSVEQAWLAVLKMTQLYQTEDRHVLVIGHNPLIMPMLAAACFGFDASHDIFDHACIAHFHTDEGLPGQLKWFASPKTASKLRECLAGHELAEGTRHLTEHLMRRSRRRIIDPMVAVVKQAVEASLKGLKSGAAAPTVINAQLNQAYRSGVRFVLPMLPQALAEAKKQKPDEWEDVDKVLLAMGGYRIDRQADEILADLESSTSTAAVDARAEATAETEISRAYHQGMSDVAAHVGAQGVQVEKQWLANPDACPACEANAEDGWIPEDVLFASGDSEPPLHPYCRCSVEYRES